MPVYELEGKRPVIASDAYVHPAAILIGDVKIGSGCFIAPGAVLRADFGPIIVGEGTSVQDNATLHVNPNERLIIGMNCIVGHNAVLHDVFVEDGCVIGMGAVLMAHVKCERGAFVAAGAVVPQNMVVPAGKLAAGNPAKVIKDVTEEMVAYATLGVLEYRKLCSRYIKGITTVG
ncbi:MAG: gamma carbonic anhydrase family protein [Syntrophales bacterium]|nr:gamma carbonic anhydrase family protein [Syntrophales bacterium]